jgi:hypothetical protein
MFTKIVLHVFPTNLNLKKYLMLENKILNDWPRDDNLMMLPLHHNFINRCTFSLG